MHPPGDPLVALLAVLGAATLGLLVAVQPFPEVGFVLQMGGVGAAIGTVVTLWRRRRNPELEASFYLVRWTVFGLGFGLLLALLDSVT